MNQNETGGRKRCHDKAAGRGPGVDKGGAREKKPKKGDFLSEI